MMATTHALYGMSVGFAVATIAPETAPVAALAGFLGGFAPDLDAYAAHRRTLHAPVLGSVLAITAVIVAAITPSLATVVLASAILAATLHAIMDVAGGGLSLEPWVEQPDRAVYSHVHARWIAPRRYVRYDGAPEDLLLAAIVGVPLLAITGGSLQVLVGATLLLSVGYVIVRRRLVGLLATVDRLTPARLRPLVPRRIEDAAQIDAE